MNPVVVGIDLPACQDAVIAWNYCANVSANNTFAIYVKGGSYNITIHNNYVVGSKFGIFIGQSSAYQNVWLNNPAGFDSATPLNPLLLITQVGPHCVLQLPDGNALWFDSLRAGSLSARDFDIQPATSAARVQHLSGKSSSKQLTVRYIGCEGLKSGGRFSRSGGSIFSIDGRKFPRAIIHEAINPANLQGSAGAGLYIFESEMRSVK